VLLVIIHLPLTLLFCRMVIRLCDELDKANDLNEYFKKTITEHINKTLLPELMKKKGESLLKEYIKEYKDYIILIHFMRKMFSYLVNSYCLTLFKGSLLSQKQLDAKSVHLRSQFLQGKVFYEDARLTEI
jgi:hypothetical protein